MFSSKWNSFFKSLIVCQFIFTRILVFCWFGSIMAMFTHQLVWNTFVEITSLINVCWMVGEFIYFSMKIFKFFIFCAMSCLEEQVVRGLQYLFTSTCLDFFSWWRGGPLIFDETVCKYSACVVLLWLIVDINSKFKFIFLHEWF